MYINNDEYLFEYMQWLNKRLTCLYLTKEEENNRDNPWRGLTISNNEIKRLVENSIDNKSGVCYQYNIREDEDLLLIEKKAAESLKKGADLYLERLCNIFQLSKIEKYLIIIAISVELDSNYEKIFGYFNNNISKIRPSVNLALEILGLQSIERNILRKSFFEESYFKKYILQYSFSKNLNPLFSNDLVLDDRVTNYVLGINETDKDICNAVKQITPDTSIDISEENSILDKINKAYYRTHKNYDNNTYIYVYGEEGTGKKENIKLFSKSINKKAVIIDLKLIIGNLDEFKISMIKSLREVILNGALLILENYQEFNTIEDEKEKNKYLRTFYKELELYIEPIFILSNEGWKNTKYVNESSLIEIKIERPEFQTRKLLWNYYIEKFNIGKIDIEDFASKFYFTPQQIKSAVISTKSKKVLNENDEKIIYESCYEQVNHNLYKRATKVNLNYSWDQLILPKEQKSLLEDACHQVKNKYKVYEQWGFSKTVAYGKGVSVVCSGPPGTGKTMSAQVFANELNLELFKIDLSQIVSKYVGETEKNLNEIFSEAKLSNAVLFFDEADSIFGKRSSINNSNDRFANIETSYLLQKIEEYEGVSILATNLLKNIDEAFIRRMKYIIQFPFPDVEARRKIWEVTMPKKAPKSRDIDYDFLAETFEVSGGNIKNILVYAAFLSASKGTKINMQNILKASKYEMQKIGKLILSQDLKEYKYLIED